MSVLKRELDLMQSSQQFYKTDSQRFPFKFQIPPLFPKNNFETPKDFAFDHKHESPKQKSMATTYQSLSKIRSEKIEFSPRPAKQQLAIKYR